MSLPEQLFPTIEGTISSLARVGESGAVWLKQVKEVMSSGQNAFKDDWAFINIPDIDESSAAATAPETGAVLYGVLVGHSSNLPDMLAICSRAAVDTISNFQANVDTTATNAAMLCLYIPGTTTDAVEEFFGYVFPTGVAFALYMSFVADGASGTALDTDDMRAWAVYRTGTTIQQA